MVAALAFNPLLKLYQSLVRQMAIANPTADISEMEPINNDKLLKVMLQYNGCAFTDEAMFIKYKLGEDETVEQNAQFDYSILYLYGAKGNEVNEFYDYIEFYGMKYLIIFMDYFKGFHDPRVKQEDDPLEFAMGKSVYYDAIKKLVEVFLATSICMAEINSPVLAATSAANNYRFAPTIIAALILRETVGIAPEDVSDINYDDLMDFLNSTSKEALLIGIRQKRKI